DLLRVRARQHHREDEGVDEQEQERVDERPEEAEDGAPVARLQVAHNEALNQAAVFQKVPEVLKHAACRAELTFCPTSVLRPSGGPSPSPRLSSSSARSAARAVRGRPPRGWWPCPSRPRPRAWPL